jgi:hypothetical protein
VVLTLEAREDLGKLKGASASHYFACNNGQVYVVKFNLGGQDHTAVNELLCCLLASELHLPAPHTALVHVSEQLISVSDDLLQRKIPPGVHVGTQRINDAFDFDDPTAKNLPTGTTITNYPELPGVVVFDTWVMNSDRNNAGNNLLQNLQTEPPSFKYWMVDFGHSFMGPNWSPETIVQNKGNPLLMSPFQFVANAVTGAASFEPILTRLEQFEASRIRSMTSLIPGEWGLQGDSCETLAEFLRYRQGMVRGVVLSDGNRGNFPNWK